LPIEDKLHSRRSLKSRKTDFEKLTKHKPNWDPFEIDSSDCDISSELE
jgi:hypothetical protein